MASRIRPAGGPVRDADAIFDALLDSGLDATDSLTRESSDTIRLSSPQCPDRFLQLRVLSPGDIELAYFVPERTGSPFEQLLVGPSRRARSGQPVRGRVRSRPGE